MTLKTPPADHDRVARTWRQRIKARFDDEEIEITNGQQTAKPATRTDPMTG
ncbi:MAG: hypothetical protein R2709_07170 [Marmoricola sp.]